MPQTSPAPPGDERSLPPEPSVVRAAGGLRLVATDLDGTLLDPAGRVSARSASAIAAARRAGIHVVPVTGRPPQATLPLLDGLGMGPFAVCSNGAIILDMHTGEVVEEWNLPGDIASGLVGRVREALPGVLFATDNLDRFCYEPSFLELPSTWEEEVCEMEDIIAALDRPCAKLIARHPGMSSAELIAALEAHVGEEGHVTTSGLDWVDIGAPGISKAYALERVCERLEVSVEGVAAVGDNHNDLSVLGWAGLALAPANAVPEVLAMVDRVLPHHSEDAVAVLLEELVSGL